MGAQMSYIANIQQTRGVRSAVMETLT
ncbi:protein of unknown function [Agreia sp. COWG]|nr:protein of unknown function [Agreia sp. COWG]